MPRLVWTGVACCVGALLVKLFPELAFKSGVDVKGAWLLFGFGVFLIIAAPVIGRSRD